MSGGVLVVGDVITDLIVLPEGPVVRGLDRRAKIRMQPGGSAANQAVWLASLGVRVKFVSRVAAADLDRHLGYFRSRQVEALLGADATAPSGVLISIVDSDGERSFLTDRGANLILSAEDLPFSLLDDVAVLLVSGYALFSAGPRAAVLALLKEARDRKIPTAVDPASVGFLREIGAEAFLKWTRRHRHLFANLDEALELTGSGRSQFADADARPLLRPRRDQARAAGAAVAAAAACSSRCRPPPAKSSTPPAPAMPSPPPSSPPNSAAAGLEDCVRAGIVRGAEAVTLIGGQPTTEL